MGASLGEAVALGVTEGSCDGTADGAGVDEALGVTEPDGAGVGVWV